MELKYNGVQLIWMVLQCLTNLVESDVPIVGHRLELGKHRPTEGHIETFDVLPSSREFWDNFASGRKPALFKGVARKFPAYDLWTDSYMFDHFGDYKVKIEGKAEKEDYPEGEMGIGQDTLRHFLSTYQEKNAYVVSQLPDPLAKDVLVMPFLNCGTFKERILEANLWLSSGGTKSLLHRDADNAINCLLNGTKDWILIDPVHEDNIPIAKEDVDAYGGFSLLNPESVDLELYPRFKEVPWWHANMTPGDCLFLPYGYWHHVRSYGDKNMAVSVLFSRLKEVNLEECDETNPGFIALSESQMVFHYNGFGDQTMGNSDPFEVKENFVDLCHRHGHLTKELIHEMLLQNYNEVDDVDIQPIDLNGDVINDVSNQIMMVLDKGMSGEVACTVLEQLTLETLLLLAGIMDDDPANTESYEYAKFQPLDISQLILDVTKEANIINNGFMTSEMFYRQYQSIGGSLKVAKEIFSVLNPNEKEEISMSDLHENIKPVMEKFQMKKMRTEVIGAQEWQKARELDTPGTKWQSDVNGHKNSHGKSRLGKDDETAEHGINNHVITDNQSGQSNHQKTTQIHDDL